jgi:glutamyl-tRNA reductase
MKQATADIAVIGFNHKTTPVEKRECFSVHTEVLPEVYARFKEQGIDEALYVATCNRVEIYIASRAVKKDIKKVTAIYESISGMLHEDFSSHLYVKTSREAVQHLLSVVSSLDSMVLGENEIVGQMRDAFGCAVDNKSVGPLLNKLFHQAFRTAKQVKTETDISRNPLSVAYIATDMARKLFPDFQNRGALLIGAGEMGELVLKYFTKYDIGRVLIANRSVNNSERIADEINRQAEIILLEDIPEAATEVDIVITSVTAPHYMVTADLAGEIMKIREGRPLFFIDIAVPRNIDPDVADVEGIHLYNIDSLQEIADDNLKSRINAVDLAREFIETNVNDFFEWVQSLDVAPAIVSIQKTFEEIRTKELARYRKKKLKHLADDDFTLIEELTRQIMTKSLHNPIMNLKRHHRTSRDDTAKKEHLHLQTKFVEELFKKNGDA